MTDNSKMPTKLLKRDFMDVIRIFKKKVDLYLLLKGIYVYQILIYATQNGKRKPIKPHKIYNIDIIQLLNSQGVVRLIDFEHSQWQFIYSPIRVLYTHKYFSMYKKKYQQCINIIKNVPSLNY